MQGDVDPSARPHVRRPVLPYRAEEAPPRLATALIDRFRNVEVPDVSDAVGLLFTMNSTIRPLYSGMRRVLGTAVTVKAVPGDNWAIHAGLSRCGPGDVLVVDWRGYVGGCGTGGIATAMAHRRGLAGVIVDGGWRDIGELKRMDFPIMGVGISPSSPGAVRFGEVNVPVHCGGVIVEPGDLVMGDEEGAVVVPRAHVELVADSLRAYEAASTASPASAPAGDDGITREAQRYWAAHSETYGSEAKPLR